MSRAAVLLVIASGLSSAAARAAEPPIGVAIADCAAPPVPADAFLRSLRVELAGEGRACCTRLASMDDAGPASGPTRLAVDGCGATPDLVQVSVRDQRTGAALDRQVALGDVAPDARPRALALAVAELLRAATAAPPGPPAAVATPAPAAAEPSEPVDGWIPLLGFAARTHPTSGGITSWGFHGGLELARGGWQAALGGHVESGAPSVALGKVNTVFAGGSLEIGRRFHPGKTALELGLTGGLGFVHMEGVTSAPRAVAAAGSGLEAAAGGRAAFDVWRIPHERAYLRLVVEGGGVIHGVEATVNGQQAAGLTGAYILGGLLAALGPF